MNEERRKILDMLAEGKIKAAEAEQLLNALEVGPKTHAAGAEESRSSAMPKYFRILVDGDDKVNIRIPFQLIRAGIKLTSLIPNDVRDKVSDKLKEKGVDFDLSKAKTQDIDELIMQLRDVSIDVQSDEETVRIFCE